MRPLMPARARVRVHVDEPFFSLRSDRFKFIDAPRPELYDLRLDPFEERNIAGRRQSLAATLQARLRTQVQREPSTAAKDRIDDELRARLAALGYVAGRAPEARTGAFLPDPKDCTGMFESATASSASNPGC
jgi:choline-sulfatase